MADITMEWKITIDEARNYAEVKTSGVADRNGSLEMARAIAVDFRKNKMKRVLIDHQNIESLSGDTTDIYERPKKFEGMGFVTNVRVALVVKPEHQVFFSFFETVCINQGYVFSLFLDRTAALEWLLQS